MANPERLDCQPVLPFLPQEPGLRAHLFRVGALASKAAEFAGYSKEEIRNVGWAGLLHHTPISHLSTATPDQPLPARLLTDLGLPVPASLATLPERASAIVRSFRRSDPDASPAIADAAFLVDSANLFDEQMENLPYEDLSTERAVGELIQSGMVAEPFARALDSFRVISRQDLAAGLGRLTAVRPQPLDMAATETELALRSCFVTSESLWAHSLEVAGLVSQVTKESVSLDPADGFLAGLVHDLGRLAFTPSNIAQELGRWQELGFPVTYAEFLVSGTDHAALGAHTLTSWGYPEPIVNAVEFHHRPELSASSLAAALYAFEDLDELLPSCARDCLAAKRIDVAVVRHHGAAG